MAAVQLLLKAWSSQRLFCPCDLFFILLAVRLSLSFSGREIPHNKTVNCKNKDLQAFQTLLGRAQPPGHRGSAGAALICLSPSPSPALSHYSPRPFGRDPGPCCEAPPPPPKLGSLEGSSLLSAAPFDCFLHLYAHLSFGPGWSGRSLWQLSDVWHPVTEGLFIDCDRAGGRCSSVRGADSSTNRQQHLTFHQRSPEMSVELSVYS